MMKFANMKIGTKLALVLGACVFLMVGLSGLALWGNNTMARHEETSRDRLTKRMLAAEVSGGASAAALYVENIAVKKATLEQKDEVLQIRKAYQSALQEFKARADSPTSKGHATDLEALVQQFIAADDQVLRLAAAGRNAEATRLFHDTSMGRSMPYGQKLRRPRNGRSSAARKPSNSARQLSRLSR
jgi:CHASE3 domain sensor protein